MGKLIVMEGACDGIGKTTQFKLLKEKLLKDGVNVMTHHFPSYGEYQGVCVEKYLNGEYGKAWNLSPYFINSLYAQDRAVTWECKLKKFYDDGGTILLDRYTTSSLIYQSALIDDIDKRKEFIKYIIDYEYEKLGIGTPDMVIFLYAPFDLVANMRANRKENDGVMNDIHETDLSYMKKVYENAMFLADLLSWDKVRCNSFDKMRDIKDIHEDVYSLVKRKYH